ncbi:lactonase, 7-bladed beta-propeller [Rhizoctonia solani 123E]|uniref:Lactonase, 7-bladed beta-propeller n=1 Tax=Rhizoctonia solani 123E TaxID=1423351 RepID=A0A074S727_9AGAM|nr:lactonase, 7-bladed beta-propeller [Rhizoctonia solani 123E]
MVYKLLVGGYAATIATLLFSPESSSLSIIATSPAGINATWITTHPTNKSVVYATQEASPGSILSFVVEESGQLTQTGSALTGGAGPPHMIITSNGKEAIAMNYNGGNGTNIPLEADKAHFGTPFPAVAFNGSSINPDRQESSHPHQVIEYGNEYLVPDLGVDKIWRLTKSSSGALQNSGYIQQPAGSGPRHVVTRGTTLYTLHEIASTLTQQNIPPLGSATQPDISASISIVPPNSTNPQSYLASELLLSPVSSAFPTQYLYAMNRGDSSDAIAIVSIAKHTLEIVAHIRTGVNFARGVALSHGGGKYLAVAGQYSGDLAIFERTNEGVGLKEIARVSGLTQPTSVAWLE